jgi:Domain of unknown function DUF1828
MNATELTGLLHSAFGTRASVRARRPERLYQINIPATLADGDGPSIFIEPAADGRVRMSDQGMTTMRLSYTSAISEASSQSLERLAERHGFSLVDGALTADVLREEILPGALGLLQVESEAEAAITAASARGKQGKRFRETVRQALETAFQGRCEFDYHTADDPEGLYALDARIAPLSASGVELLVAVTPNELDAERSVAAVLHIARARSLVGPGVVKMRTRSVAIPRDVNELENRTRLRLMREYLVPVPRYDEEPPGRMAEKLMELSA